jgi:hypothetical protein
MRKLLPILLCIIVFACKTESDVTPAEGTFIRYFGSENNHTAVLAMEVDNGYTLLSNLDIQIDLIFTNKIQLTRTDPNGNLLWEKSYPAFEQTLKTVSLKASSFIPLANSGYLIVGDSIKANGSTDLLLLFLDPEGAVQKMATISLENLPTSTKSLHGRAVIQDSDGNYLILGKIEGDGTNDMYVAKYSSQTLQPMWERKYGAGTSSLINRLYLDSNNLLWAGSVLTSDKYDVRIVRAAENSQLPSKGSPLTTPDIDEHANDFCEAFGGWFITGSTNKDVDDDIYYAKVSSNLEKIFSGSIRMTGATDEGNSICQASDGSIIILGTVESGTNQKDLFITKIDANGVLTDDGNPIWGFNYGGSDDQVGASVRELSDKSFLIFGTTSFGRVKKLILMKVTKDGTL